MAIEKLEGGTIIITEEHIPIYRLLVLWSGLKFEAKTGMQMSRGRSCYSIVKQEFGLKGNKQKVFEQFDKILREKGVVKDKPAQPVGVVGGQEVGP